MARRSTQHVPGDSASVVIQHEFSTGLLGLTKDLAMEGARENILVNAVCPGFIDTPMTQAMPPEAREAMKDRIPLGRLGDPRDIALAVFALLTNKYKTGSVDYVNGGLYM